MITYVRNVMILFLLQTACHTCMCAVDARSMFLMMNIINLLLYSRDRDFLNHLECSLSNVCYILYKNNINKNEKTF